MRFNLPLAPAVLARFQARRLVGGEDDCWPWTGPTDGGGYGKLFVEGRYVGAHRVALTRHLERHLLPGMKALHTCDNEPCCNPRHLYEGTQKQNMRDMMARARRSLPRGEAWKAAHGHETHRQGVESASSKFTEAQVFAIRGRINNGESRAELAREFGVSWPAINNIGRGKTYGRLVQIDD